MSSLFEIPSWVVQCFGNSFIQIFKNGSSPMAGFSLFWKYGLFMSYMQAIYIFSRSSGVTISICTA